MSSAKYKILGMMFERFPRATFLLAAGFIGLPYVKPVKDFFIPPKSYEDGKKDGEKYGYDKARKELRDMAENKVVRTMDYINGDKKKIEAKEEVADAYLKGKVAIHLLPRWDLKLLGDDYIVRRPLYAQNNEAFFMTRAHSENMDTSIRDTLSKTEYDIDEVKIGLAQNALKHDIQNLILGYCDKVLKTDSQKK